MTNFLTHEPCPKCKSRDNVGVYSDGHKWCFGCGWYQPATRTIKNARSDGSSISPITTSSVPNFVQLPLNCIQYLKQYDLTNEEIQQNFKYDPERELLVYGFPGGYSGRYMRSGQKPRYFFSGQKAYKHLLVGSGERPVEPLVIVEDIVSAIKVGRSATALPLFGSSIPLEDLRTVSEPFSRVRIWLDSDKHRQSLQMASRLALVTGKDVRTIYTRLDPKCQNDARIRELLELAAV